MRKAGTAAWERATARPAEWAVRNRGAAAAFEWLGHLLAREFAAGLMFPLCAIAFAGGIIVYFVAPDEPHVLAGPIALLAAAVLAWRARHHRRLTLVLLAILAGLSGFSLVSLRARLSGTLVLAAPTRTITLTGWLSAVEPRSNGATRLVLRLTAADPPLSTPQRAVRLTLRGSANDAELTPGRLVRLRARLLPPPQPNRPGSYDFARDLFFIGYGATGFVVGRAEIVATQEPPPLSIRAAAWIERARQAVSGRIRSQISGEHAALADALVTGRRDGISENTNDMLRRAGVFHILSISGFHMALVTALVFALVRGAMALVPMIALTRPAKAYAAGTALIVSTLYLLLSGAEVATQRSWLMLAVVLLAVMLGREALTIRTLALAMIGVLILAPEAIMGPSFQMSFAATLVLVAGATTLWPALSRWRAGESRRGRALLALTRGLVGLAMASLLAGLATAPYGAYHFNRVHAYGLIGNVVTAPVIEFLTMPLELLALMLWPFGMDGPIWAVVAQTIELFLRLCGWVAALPGGAIPVPSIPGTAIGLFTLALLMVSILRTRLRLFALVPLVLAAALLPFGERPDVLIDAGGASIAARDSNGDLIVLSQRPSAFTLQQWQAAEALKSGADASAARHCDHHGCSVADKEGRRIVVSHDSAALADDCRQAALIISPNLPSFSCAAQVFALSRLTQSGAIAITRQPNGTYRIDTARQPGSRRLWHPPEPKITSEPGEGTQPAPVNSDE